MKNFATSFFRRFFNVHSGNPDILTGFKMKAAMDSASGSGALPCELYSKFL